MLCLKSRNSGETRSAKAKKRKTLVFIDFNIYAYLFIYFYFFILFLRLLDTPINSKDIFFIYIEIFRIYHYVGYVTSIEDCNCFFFFVFFVFFKELTGIGYAFGRPDFVTDLQRDVSINCI